jgi:hypothetical protein
VDNVGRNNYVVLQFSQSVKLDKAYPGLRGQRQRHAGVDRQLGGPITTMNNSVLSSMSFSEVNTTT